VAGNKRSNRFAIVVYGPTATGKSDFAVRLALQMPAEIINMDVAQFYAPLRVGTAKPDWQHAPVPHHLFDLLDQPENFTAVAYRTRVSSVIDDIWQRGKVPILVGGSGFYLRSLIFPPLEQSAVAETTGGSSWQELHAIDPVRAQQIEKHDTYRIARALDIWRSTGQKPSSLAPTYDPLCSLFIVHVTRERDELRERIAARATQMAAEGLVDEAASLLDTPWQKFVSRKGFIGYRELFSYLQAERTPASLRQAMDKLVTQTRRYAKRQETFWRSLQQLLAPRVRQPNGSLPLQDSGQPWLRTCSLNLTTFDQEQYIERLLKQVSQLHYPNGDHGHSQDR